MIYLIMSEKSFNNCLNWLYICSMNCKRDQSNREEILSGKIIPMLLKLAVPILIGMVVQLIYNVTDTLWLGRIDLNDEGIVGGTGLVFPVVFMALGLANGLQTGVSAHTARSIGKDDELEISKVPTNALFLAGILIFVVMVPTFIWSKQILLAMGATGSFFEHGHTYFRAIIPAAIAMFLSSVLNGVLQGEGRMKHVMIAMVIGTVSNLILDPIFIFPLGLGVKGAAYATVIAQLGALIYSIWVFKKHKATTLFRIKKSFFNWKTVYEILSIGAPQVITFSIMVFSIVILNKLVVGIDPQAMTAFSLVSRFDSVQFIPILALSSAMVTAVGQNYGAKNLRRIRRIWRTAAVLAGVMSIMMALLLIIFAPYIFPFFTGIDTVVDYSVRQIRTVNIFFTAAVFGILARSVFQGINNPIPALLLTLLRLVIITIPIAFILVKKMGMGVEGVWYGMIAGCIIAGCSSYIWVEKVLKCEIRKSEKDIAEE